MVERKPEKFCVVGSIPTLGTNTYMSDPKPEMTAGDMAKCSWSGKLPLCPKLALQTEG